MKPLARIGGRKWCAFLLLTAVFVVFVVLGFIKSETIIRDLFLGLLAIYGASNVGARAADRINHTEPAPTVTTASSIGFVPDGDRP